MVMLILESVCDFRIPLTLPSLSPDVRRYAGDIDQYWLLLATLVFATLCKRGRLNITMGFPGI